jgi:hypothetical protein
MSLGMSTSTGPGRPVVAMWKASRMTRGMSAASVTSSLCLVMPRVMPTMSTSWKASVPMAAVATWPVMTTMGIESMKASAIGVTMLVAPGPDVTMATPGRPVACA